MSKQSTHKDQNPEEIVVQATEQSVQFIEKHKKNLIYGGSVIIALVLLFFAYNKFYNEPLVQEAMAQTFVAEQYFRTDSFALALNGDGNSLGFEDIIDEYGSKAGEAIYMYAGVSALQLKEYEKAIDYLKKYNGKDPILNARSIANIGDCYAGLGDLEEAVDYYVEAANYVDNAYAVTYLLKAGLIYEALENYEDALEQYQIVKDKYSNTQEGYQIDKYIERIKNRK